jgi:hypothetical protein
MDHPIRNIHFLNMDHKGPSYEYTHKNILCLLFDLCFALESNSIIVNELTNH